MSGTSSPSPVGAHDDARRRRRSRRRRRACATTHTPESTRDARLHAGADERRLGADQRHGLALHVRAHERAVRVVVLEERNQRRGHRHHLVRRHVHQLDLVGRRHAELAVVASADQRVREACPSRRSSAFGLRDVLALFLERAVPAHLVA